jgi:hypothetical protein
MNPKYYSDTNKPFIVEECRSKLPDLSLYLNDDLNFHEDALYVLRKDGHYDIIYRKGYPYKDLE